MKIVPISRGVRAPRRTHAHVGRGIALLSKREELASALGWPPGRVTALYRKQKPSRATIQRVAAALGLSVDDIMRAARGEVAR